MLDIFNTPSPQSANYQEFYGGGSTRDWLKPRGASMVRFMLIGSGGRGGGSNTTGGGTGGGSGAVTSWIGPAIFIPDQLRIYVAASSNGTDVTSVIYQAKNSSGYTLLTADGGFDGNSGITGGGAGGAAMTANYFTASGIFTSIAGQNGANGSASGSGSNISASATTFLSGGAGGAGSAAGTGGSVTPNYGYTALPATTAGGAVAGANGVSAFC